MKYRTREGDMLDQICRAHYGRSDAVPQVLEANPYLAEQPAILPGNLIIELPILASPTEATTTVRLWD